jgi:hypothetical protein
MPPEYQEDRRKAPPVTVSKEELVEAIREGFIQALNSPQAIEAVEGAVTAWFDKQSGKAMRRVLNALALSGLLLFATNFGNVKQWLTTFTK